MEPQTVRLVTSPSQEAMWWAWDNATPSEMLTAIGIFVVIVGLFVFAAVIPDVIRNWRRTRKRKRSW